MRLINWRTSESLHMANTRTLTPALPSALGSDRSIFGAIRAGDILLHHPYDSFAPVVELIESAAEPLPFQINVDGDGSEDMRLRYRFLDLRPPHFR